MPLTSPRASGIAYPPVPVDWSGDQAHLDRQQSQAINRLIDGKSNAKGSITLTANQATTTLIDRRIGSDSHISFTATTANAATERATMYVSARGKQTATITHANNAQSDRTFTYAFADLASALGNAAANFASTFGNALTGLHDAAHRTTADLTSAFDHARGRGRSAFHCALDRLYLLSVDSEGKRGNGRCSHN